MFLTGHGIFKSHLNKIGFVHDVTCRFCQLEDETAEHLLSDCIQFAYHRNILLGNDTVQSKNFSSLDFNTLCLYLRATGLTEKFNEFESLNR